MVESFHTRIPTLSEAELQAYLRDPLGYEPEDTKRYLRDLEMYGGKANILATQFRRWFGGLWQGRPLAGTLAALTVLLAGGFWFAASRLAPGPPEGPT